MQEDDRRAFAFVGHLEAEPVCFDPRHQAFVGSAAGANMRLM